MDFLDLWRFGIPQLDAWRESSLPRPDYPACPRHNRAARTLPPSPRLWEIQRATLTPEQIDLMVETDWDALIEDNLLAEHCGFGFDMSGERAKRMAIEGVADRIATGESLPYWTADLAATLALMSALDVAEALYTLSDREHGRECSAIHSAPDADPAWAAYDAAVRAWPETTAVHREQVRLRAVRITGFATEQDAADDYWSRHLYGGYHVLMGYPPPRDIPATLGELQTAMLAVVRMS